MCQQKIFKGEGKGCGNDVIFLSNLKKEEKIAGAGSASEERYFGP